MGIFRYGIMSDNQKNTAHAPGLRLVKGLSYLLDEQFRFPGTRFRFGIDPLINLFPVFGDMAGFIVSAGLVLSMAGKGASGKLVVLMCINILLDGTMGAIPIIGQVFDFYFKANSRNIKLMEAHYLEGKYQGSGRNTVILALVILFIILILLIFLLWKLGEWITGLVQLG
jgi:hypothetical protein